MANQIEKEENEISEKNKIFSTQEEKIKSMEIESKGTISISVKEVTFSLETPLLATPGKLIQIFFSKMSVFRVVTQTHFWKTFQFPVHTLLIMVNFRNNSSESTLGSFKGITSRRIY